jgi:tRNA threonylcarbamoyl adenosine modification protein YeaZ
MDRRAAVLALDTASPTVSVAVGWDGEVAAHREVEIGRSSERLLGMMAEVLAEAGLAGPGDLAGLVALAGPGSFTGLRVGLATALGIHQALGVPATALPTLGVLAAAAPAEARRVVAVVDVLRGEWAVGQHRATGGPGPPDAVGPARRLTTAELVALLAAAAPVHAVGFGLGPLAAAFGGAPPAGLHLLEPTALAPVAVRLATRHPPAWDAAALTHPVYFRPPAVTLPRQGAGPA